MRSLFRLAALIILLSNINYILSTSEEDEGAPFIDLTRVFPVYFDPPQK